MKKPTDQQIVEFIRESNAIEEIHHPLKDVEQGWQQRSHACQEIDGHVKAFDKMLELMFKDKFGEIKLEDICTLHTVLMEKLLEPWDLGFRRVWVRVGPRLCPPPAAVRPLLEKWCQKVNQLENPTEDAILQTHLAYEYIHPFIDGNGRSGRLLWIWLRYKFGYGYKCIFDRTKRQDYYPLFDQFNWENWIVQK